jgi:F5/8 type C domain
MTRAPLTTPRLQNSAAALAGGLVMLAATCNAAPPVRDPVQVKSAKASSALPAYPASLAIDDRVSDPSRWVSRPSKDPSWIELDLGNTQRLGGIHLFTGHGEKDAIASFQVQCWMNGRWTDIPSAAVSNNKATALAVPFDQTLDVHTGKLRLWITATHQGTARIKEVVVWPYGNLPPLQDAGGHATASSQSTIPKIYLNQSGFNLGKPKRFTAPGLADATPFVVRAARGGETLFRGVIDGHIGDFSSFNPGAEDEYVVEAGGITSVPFRIGPFWLERVTYQNAVDFMIDSRHRVGNDRNECRGSFGWRDDHHFGWELHTLVPKYLSNPSAYERMPRQVKYEKPKDAALWGALEPYRDDAPDIVKLIHWGADIIVTQKLGHEHLKAQLAYFLHAWPTLKAWLPEQNYVAVRDYAFKTWADPGKDRDYPYDESPENNLLALKTRIGSTKGCLPPGFSVEPNLLMHEVAKREKRPDAGAYFHAAFRQVEWMVKHLDWNDPLVTKGQRMSEFLTVTGLAHFLREYPDKAPKGLAEKLQAWAAVVIRRSENPWDFRKLGDGPDEWTPMGDSPQKWNEPGNVIGLPASIIAVSPFIRDEKSKQRLEKILWAHFDNMFGRNPVGRHFSFDAPREIEGVEHGWFKFHVGGIGRLAEARFVIDGSPKNAHYPYHPEVGDIGWTEGWIQFNAAYDISLAYLAWSETRIQATVEGGEYVVRLTAPLNFDYQKVENATVVVASGLGDEERLTVTEDSASAATLTGRIRIQAAPTSRPGDGSLQWKPGTTLKASYGFGYLGHSTHKP